MMTFLVTWHLTSLIAITLNAPTQTDPDKQVTEDS